MAIELWTKLDALVAAAQQACAQQFKIYNCLRTMDDTLWDMKKLLQSIDVRLDPRYKGGGNA